MPYHVATILYLNKLILNIAKNPEKLEKVQKLHTTKFDTVVEKKGLADF